VPSIALKCVSTGRRLSNVSSFAAIVLPSADWATP
jgi:hypothetical protein